MKTISIQIPEYIDLPENDLLKAIYNGLAFMLVGENKITLAQGAAMTGMTKMEFYKFITGWGMPYTGKDVYESLDISEIKEIIASILNVAKAYLCGSYARGDQTPYCDIDIFVNFYPEDNKSIFDLLNLKEELEKTLDKKVDIKNQISLHWAKTFEKEKILIYDGNERIGGD